MQSNKIFAQHTQGSPVLKNKTKIRHSNGVHHSPAYLRQRGPPTNKDSSSVMPYLSRYQLLGGYMSWVGPGCINTGPTICTLFNYIKTHTHTFIILYRQRLTSAAAVSTVWLRYSNKWAGTVFPFHRAKVHDKRVATVQLQYMCMLYKTRCIYIHCVPQYIQWKLVKYLHSIYE